jgi:hypothetical protein
MSKYSKGWYLFMWNHATGKKYNSSNDFAIYYYSGRKWYSHSRPQKDEMISEKTLFNNFELLTKVDI